MKITESTYNYNSLEFEAVSNMYKLIDSIKLDEFYKKLYFFVTEIESLKSEEYKGHIKRKNTYVFGNKKYHKVWDVVNIHVYIDCVELSYPRDNRGTIKKDLNMNRSCSLEDTILLILDEWRKCY